MRRGPKPGTARVSEDVRFLANLIEPDEMGCIIWQGGRSDHGYGTFGISRPRPQHMLTIPAHLWAWIRMNGPVPKGMELDHRCRIRSCVNPEHLEPVTHRENGLRGTSPWAINARKTNCPQGHPLIWVEPSTGRRRCRICANQARKRSEKRRKQRE